MSYEDIHFANPTAGIDLAGMLFVPEGEPPFPAVVIIHGSGTSRRASPWYLTYAGYLQGNGILVLLPDKRGSESSGGDWRTSSLEDLATDTPSAISYLRTERPQLVRSIGILGVSQGGVIAPIVASETSDLAFVINVVGGAVPMYDQLLYEQNHNLRQMGFLPGFSNALAYLTTRTATSGQPSATLTPYPIGEGSLYLRLYSSGIRTPMCPPNKVGTG